MEETERYNEINETVEEPVSEIEPVEEPVSTPEETEKKPVKESPMKILFSWVDDLALYFTVFMLIMSFFVRPCTVQGKSMRDTLYNGDVLLLSVIPTKPQRGDIIVVTRENVTDRPLIKRVIAVGGDTVLVDYNNNTVYVNGEAIDEPYLAERVKEGAFGEGYDAYTRNVSYVVPENCVYVMGDNRDESTDSRTQDVGALEYGQILGKVIFRVYHDTSDGGSLFGTVN